MDLDFAMQVLAPVQRILVFTGAGISTESGIPDFRGPNGLWTRMDPADFTIDRYLGDAEVRKRSWQMYFQGSFGSMLNAQPNPAHHAIVRLWKLGKWAGCVTQNIDGLHQAAGLPDDEVAELHGNLRNAGCVSCRATWSAEEVLGWVAAGQSDPRCPRCGGIVKTSTVLFGELLPEQAVERALNMAARADAVVAVGTTLTVSPAADLAASAVHDGARLVIVNQGETAFDHLADVKLDAPAGEALPRLVEKIGPPRP